MDYIRYCLLLPVFGNKVTTEDVLRIKAEVLCWGLGESSAADEIYLVQHPTVHKRTGNAGLHVVLEDKIVLNAIYGEKFCERSPYHIDKVNGEFWLVQDKTLMCKFSIIKAPRWYQRQTSDGILMADILLQEGLETLTCGVWNNCCYFQNETQCKFCVLGLERGGVEWKKVNHIVETVGVALKENPNYYLHLTGGNTFTPDHGIKYYEKYVKAVRKEYRQTPISLEVSPPENIKDLESIINSGANGFSINIEVWDEGRRRKICPGKGQIDRRLYFKSWQRGVELLGKFRISSVMIVGLDKAESIKKGIKQMIEMNVKPVLLPFRPFDKCALNHLNPPDPQQLLELSLIAGRELKKAKAKEEVFVGCEHCGACSTEKDFMVYL